MRDAVTDQELERLQKKARGRFILLGVCTAIVFELVLAVFGMYMYHDTEYAIYERIFAAIAALVAAGGFAGIFYALFVKRAYNSFDLNFKNQYVLPTLQSAGLFDDLEYHSLSGLSYDEIRDGAVVACGQREYFHSEDLLNGKYQDVRFSYCDVETIVLEKAAAGDAYCQYAIGCTYFWWDFFAIQGKEPEDFPNREAAAAYIRENVTQCEDWFRKSFRGGMYAAGNNLYTYYYKGEEGYIAPQREKADAVYQTGAEMGYAVHQLFHAQVLEEAGRTEEAVEWYRKEAEGGQLGLWYKLGRFYEDGDVVPQDLMQSVYCYERSAAEGEVGGVNRMGDAYYHGRGVPQDRAKAFEYCRRAYEEMDNSYGVDFLARCYLEGWGTVPNYEKAYAYAWEYKGEPLSQYILGRIYCEGLGMPEDIATGVDFLKRASDDVPEAAEELRKYKKTLFGTRR